MLKEVKEIIEMHRENGGVGVLEDGIIRVYDKLVGNIYTDEVEYEPITKGFEELAFVKVRSYDVVYTLYANGSCDLEMLYTPFTDNVD